jgi:NADH dehydrogenase
MKVSVIGGTGFVGSYIVGRLLSAGHTPHLLVRPGNEHRVEQPEKCVIFTGEVENRDVLSSCLEGTDSVIFLIGILREFPERGILFEDLQLRAAETTIQTARDQGVGRCLLMSANGVKPDGTAYQRSKYMAEEALKSSDLDWTIFRPSVIFGDPRGRMEFCTQLKREIIDSPLPAPLFYDGLLPLGAGAFELAPVHVDDVAQAFVRALDMPETIGQSFQLCGPDKVSWKQIISTIASAVGKTKLMLPAPALAIKGVAALLDRQPWFPITRDQVTMLLEGNVCSESGALQFFGIDPIRFDELTLDYLR